MYNSRNIDDLRSDVAANCRVWLELCREAGLQVLITGTVRDEEYQQQCYRNGTSKSPRPAFHAQGVGLAFDFCRNIKGHEYDDLEFFRRAGELGELVGFEWGGRWTSFVDRPHLQWSGPNHELTSKDIWAGKRPPTMPLYKESDTVSDTHWADAAYQYLHDKTGMTLDTRDWDNPITRGEAIAMIAKAHGYVPETTEPEAPVKQSTAYWRNGLHIREYPFGTFGLRWWDKSKRTTAIKNYCNANYFIGTKIGGQYVTEPAANLVADIDLSQYSNATIKEYLAAKMAGGKIRYGCQSTWDTKFKDRLVSTLIVTDNGVSIQRCNTPPTDAVYAVSGMPIMRDGADVSWQNDVLPEGWGTDPVYATLHICLGIDASGTIYRIAGRTKTSNCIQSSELYKAIQALGLGITDALMLDGGGSGIVDEGGTNILVEDGTADSDKNRQINCIIW